MRLFCAPVPSLSLLLLLCRVCESENNRFIFFLLLLNLKNTGSFHPLRVHVDVFDVILKFAQSEPSPVWIQLTHVHIVTAGPIDASASENEKFLLLFMIGDC